jgi:hypothetical protein
MDAELYDEIILNTIFPFMSDNRDIVHLHQDNDSKHSSARCLKTISDLGIDWASFYYKRLIRGLEKYIFRNF